MTDAFSSPEYQPHHPPPPYDPFLPSAPPFVPSWPPQPQSAETMRLAVVGRPSDLGSLRGAYRRQRRAATFTALGYFSLFLLLSAFAPSLMTGTVSGGVPTGLLLGLLQLPVTCLSIWLYEYTARRRVDPIADRMRKQAEADARRGAAR
ncbi:DUF485 domain-containing protein [Streptomyces sp. AF1A]|jgi:uncharacterized membrane protein (DUF485 family)|uniref:DUF485 domain-containing protein n=1 Tax=Streptomyces sp. AF1A TaxID=3394350 RepID=UPI0039BC55B0